MCAQRPSYRVIYKYPDFTPLALSACRKIASLHLYFDILNLSDDTRKVVPVTFKGEVHRWAIFLYVVSPYVYGKDLLFYLEPQV